MTVKQAAAKAKMTKSGILQAGLRGHFKMVKIPDPYFRKDKQGQPSHVWDINEVSFNQWLMRRAGR